MRFFGIFCVSFFAVAGTSTPSMAIGYKDVVNCAETAGKFANVIPVFQFGHLALQTAGVLPDKEREFRQRLEKQNAEIKAGIVHLSDGLKEINKSLESISEKVDAIPERVRGSDIYLEVYTILKRVTRDRIVTANELENIKRDLQKVLDQAEAASALAPAELYYFSAVNLMVVALAKTYDAEQELSPTATNREYYVQNTKNVESLLSHCERSYSLVSREKLLRDEYDRRVALVNSHLTTNGLIGILGTTERAEDKWVPFAFKKSERYEVKSPESRRIVLFKLEKQYETRVTQKCYAFERGETCQVDQLPTARGGDIQLYRPLDIKSIKEFTSTEISQLAPGKKYEAKQVDGSIDDHLQKTVDGYNQLAEQVLPSAYQLVLARGLHKWLDESNKVVVDLKKSIDTHVAKK